VAKLVSREMEVLQLIAGGNANKETAAEPGIGLKTVEKHREHLMRKLDIHDTADLTRYAIREGIIEGGAQLPAAVEEIPGVPAFTFPRWAFCNLAINRMGEG